MRVKKPYNYLTGTLALGISYSGFLNSLSYFLEFAINRETLVTIASMIVTTLAYLAVINYVFTSLEELMLSNFKERLEQKEEFNTVLDYLEESIIIISEDKI
jgi:hypothetical protein